MGDRCPSVPSVQRAREGVRCIFQHLKDRQDLALRSARCAEEGLAQFKCTFRAEVDRVVRDALDAFGKEVQAAFWETLLATPCDPFDGWKYKRLLSRERPCIWSPFTIRDDAETSAAIAAQMPALRGHHVIGSQTKPVLVYGGSAVLDVARCVLFRGGGCDGSSSVAICVVVRSRGLHDTDPDVKVVALSMYTADMGVVDSVPLSIDAYLGQATGVVRAILSESGAALGFSTIDAVRTTWVPQRGKPIDDEARAAKASVKQLGLYSGAASLECIMKWTSTSGYRFVAAVRECGEWAYHVWDVRGRAVAAYAVDPARAELTRLQK